MQMICPYCNQPATYAPNEEYYGRRYGRSYMCYFCKPCDAYVGTHNNTEVPLGTMANKELRQLRRKAHHFFDKLWKNGKMSRSEAYEKLARTFKKETHIGESDIETCNLIIRYSIEMNKI